MLLLTNEERQRFIQWLELDAMSNNSIVNQMGLLGDVAKPLADKYKREIAAQMLVAAKLRSLESQTITKATNQT